MLHNPLRQELRTQRAAVIPSNNEFVLLEWLESTGRLIGREPQEAEYPDEVEEISELIAVDDLIYDNESDDDDVDLED